MKGVSCQTQIILECFKDLLGSVLNMKLSKTSIKLSVSHTMQLPTCNYPRGRILVLILLKDAVQFLNLNAPFVT